MQTVSQKLRQSKYATPDAAAILFLIAIWVLFFWQMLTPIKGDQISLQKGDFSGQFVAFGAYQYDRLTSGEIPLWNPYNNAGFSFIADTQSAVFYPPRLITIAFAHALGGWSYHALEVEMMVHVLAYSLLMYAFVRRLTHTQSGSVYGALIAAVAVSYSGFTVGYPLLQLAILEAVIWLPLGLLGIYEATGTPTPRWTWLTVTGSALGISWMAGHPQTSYFMTLLFVAYYLYSHLRNAEKCFAASTLKNAVGGIALFGIISFGIAAVQLLPGFEYLTKTARAGFGYEDMSNGFPVQDVIQFIYPSVVSVFSPLFISITALLFAMIALARRVPQALFWGIVALFALLWSFGGNGVLYPLLYNIMPGLRFFRGQERAALLVVNSLAILAGLGASALITTTAHDLRPNLQTWLNRAFVASLIFAAFVIVAWLGNADDYGAVIAPVVQSTLVIGLLCALLPRLTQRITWQHFAIIAIMIAELFTVSMSSPAIYDSIPPNEQIAITPPPIIAPVLTDDTPAFRVDGIRGVHDNYASLYKVRDIRGISPLFLANVWEIIGHDHINPIAWELLAVRYVWSDWQELPVASEIIATGEDRFGAVNLHRLADPRSFANLIYSAAIVPDDNAALAQLRDPHLNPRHHILLNHDPQLTLPDTAPNDANATVTHFAPEHYEITISTPANAILSIAMPHYAGWHATLNGEPVDILRAYGALSAVAVPAGDHTLIVTYQPLSYTLGAVVSLATWIALGILLGWYRLNRSSTKSTLSIHVVEKNA